MHKIKNAEHTIPFCSRQPHQEKRAQSRDRPTEKLAWTHPGNMPQPVQSTQTIWHYANVQHPASDPCQSVWVECTVKKLLSRAPIPCQFEPARKWSWSILPHQNPAKKNWGLRLFVFLGCFNQILTNRQRWTCRGPFHSGHVHVGSEQPYPAIHTAIRFQSFEQLNGIMQYLQ